MTRSIVSKRRRRRMRGKGRQRRSIVLEIAPSSRGRRFLTVDLLPEQVQAIVETRMDPRHNYLNALID